LLNHSAKGFVTSLPDPGRKRAAPARGVPRSKFRTEGYEVVRSVLRPSAARRLGRRVAASVRRFGGEDVQVSGSPARYGDDLTERLLVELQAQVERVSGVRLFPTYSYSRVYQKGAVLARHTDRPACEVSLSLNLSYDAARPWPLWIEGRRTRTAVLLEPGDAVVYRGIDCPHWRDAFEGVECVQVFLHYVAKHGRNAAWRNDRRGA
jgi:hypothetical protein